MQKSMRIAIVSDIHGNGTAFEAVLADLRETSPDLTLHGGDLTDPGSSPAEIIDHIRDLGWSGVLGNTDEMHSRPESLDEFAAQSSAPRGLWSTIREMAAFTRDVLGSQRIAWLSSLPRVHIQAPIALVHGRPETPWRAPSADANDQEFQSTYEPLGQPIVVYGHIHRPFIRQLTHLLIANTGSVSLSYDGDPRAAYLLIDDATPTIRRVPYDLEKEIAALASSGLPHADWIAKSLRTATPQMP